MIQHKKLKKILSAAVVIIFGSLLLPSATVCAQPSGVAAGSSGIGVDGSRDAFPSVDVGTAMGDSPTTTTAKPAPQAPQTQAVPAPQAPQTVPAPQVPTEQAKPMSAAERLLDAISKHPTGKEVRRAEWRADQDKAVLAAREGHYDLALPMLEQLSKDHPTDLSVASDHAAVLGWAGHDSEAVAAYKVLPAGDRPDYLIDAIGHSYRNLHQPDDALVVYRLGLQTYPENQSFVAGEIFSLIESGHIDDAVAHAKVASEKFAAPVDPLAMAIREAFRSKAVSLARTGHYKEALANFASLHSKYPDDNDITGDYVAALSWAGHDVEATTLFRTLPTGSQPDYILDAAAHSYRNLHQPKQALELYQSALDKTPDNITYAVGVIYSLADLGRSNEALKMAQTQLDKHPEKPEALVKAYSYVERHRAIDLARAGHYDQALALLRQLRAKYPNDSSEVMDYIAVSSWAGHDKDAVKEFQKIAREAMPDYVLEAVAHSYRALQKPDMALAVYRRGLKQSPRNEIFAAGEIRCLDDLTIYAEGEERAKAYLHSYGDHLEVLLAGGEAANLNDDHVEAMNFYERANGLSPQNKEGLRGLVHAEDASGAPHLALALADKHPGLMKGDEYRSIVMNADSRLVRWGPLEPASEATRYDETDLAITTLDAHIGQWMAQDDPATYPDIMRARFDRLVALRDRSRMQDVVDDYNALVQSGVEIPAYALIAVGDAYLYLRQPEIARDVFLKVLETHPQEFEARRLLAYSYLECEQYDLSYATIDKLVEDEPTWMYLKGEPERQPNPDRATAERDAGEIRAFSDELQEADDHLTPLAVAGPGDAKNRTAAGSLYAMRGWFRKAMEEFQVALAIQNGHDVGSETGIALADLDLQNFQEAEAGLQNLTARFPEDLGVQRANRLWEVHNMAELDVHAGYNFAPTGSEAVINSPHGQGLEAGAEIYSSPIDYNWRLFAGEDFAHEREPSAEGIIDYSRSNAGVEYRKGDVTASAAPTFNDYNGHQRVGVDGKANYTFNDIWSAGLGVALFSGQTPLRALNAGVTADQYETAVTWRQSESRSATFTATAMPFSDGNFRTMQEAEYIERLYTDPNFELDAEGNLGTTQDNKNENRLYYNPSMDLSALAGLRLTNTLYRHYETLYQHSLLAMPGLYAQQHYGTSPAWLIRYEQRLHYNDTLNAGVGVNYSHQDYDGASTDSVSLTMDVVERF